MRVDSSFVAREESNGILVLAAMKRGRLDGASIFASLTLRDHEGGNSLVKVNSERGIDMMFQTPHRTDISRSRNQHHRIFAQLAFPANAKLSAASGKHV